MERLPILYYRKLKPNPTVWVPSMQMNVTLKTSDYDGDVFLGVTQYAWNGCCSFGYLENKRYPSEAVERVELEVGEGCFADSTQYTKSEVDNLLHPLMYMDFSNFL